MTRLSLDALLDSLTPEALWRLIDTEEVRDACGVPRIGHVIAGNTPLLAWTSLLRALLMRSASVVKLPSGEAAEWGRLFHASLAAVSPALASAIELRQWRGRRHRTRPGAVRERGSGTRLRQRPDHCGPARPLPARHAVDRLRPPCLLRPAPAGRGRSLRPRTASPPTFCSMTRAAAFRRRPFSWRAAGRRTQSFAARLADALAAAVPDYPCRIAPPTPPRASGRPASSPAWRLERDSGKTRPCAGPSSPAPSPLFALSPTHGVVSVQPLASLEDLPAALAPVRNHLQGCALATPSPAPHYWRLAGGRRLLRLPPRTPAGAAVGLAPGRPARSAFAPARDGFAGTISGKETGNKSTSA